MRRKNRKKYYYILLFIALFGMSFGYATLNTTLILTELLLYKKTLGIYTLKI